MNTPDACAACDYVYADVPHVVIAPRLQAVAASFASLLDSTPADALRGRPADDVWSPLEYAAHVRDVLWNIRDRIFLALVEEHPTFARVYPDQRAELGRYKDEDPCEVADQIVTGAAALGRVIALLTAEQLARTGVYAGDDREVLWIARQALHEATHHLDDAERGLSAAQ
jgi:S-DNA-T family DNA segregation ATPase FtsK/SpoIIIE